VLVEGLIRRVGTGQTLAIWMINWLSFESLCRPIRSDEPTLSWLVSELINQAEVARKYDMLGEFFTSLDATKGAASLYTSSVYHMLAHQREQHDAAVQNIIGRSDHRIDSKQWMSVWKVRLP
jgi:hypothetical protein